MTFNKLIEAPMDIKQQILSGLLVIVSMLLPCVSIAQTLSPEETAFLKSLNGKWNQDSEAPEKWGVALYDITLRYVNGIVKVSYPAKILISNKKRTILATEVTDGIYDQSSQSVRISYKHHILDTDEEEDRYRYMDYKVSLSIPLQSDVDDTLLVYCHDIYPFGDQYSKEVMYYKH